MQSLSLFVAVIISREFHRNPFSILAKRKTYNYLARERDSGRDVQGKDIMIGCRGIKIGGTWPNFGAYTPDPNVTLEPPMVTVRAGDQCYLYVLFVRTP